MPPRTSADDRLAGLESGAEAAVSDALPALLGAALGDRHYRVVALAARLAGDRLTYDNIPDLIAAYPRALVEVAELLLDSEPPVRAGAARAIACGDPREAEQLLRLKVLAGDEDPLVLADSFAGLLTVEPDESPAFVARFLEHEDEAIVEAAALALGESRIPAAFEFLRQAWDAVLASADLERAFLRAAAFHRSEAFEQHCLEA